MRIFGSERLDKVLSTLGMKEGEAIVHPWVNKSLEKAQAKVEGRNFDIRKQLAEVRRRDERPAQGDLRPAAWRSWRPRIFRRSCRTCAIR